MDREELKERMGGYFWRVLRACSQLVNAVLGGHEDETFSSRIELAANAGSVLAEYIRRAINKVSGNPLHCVEAYTMDRERARLLAGEVS